jgi:t-SNARE complex subunit (syntaxin)
VRWWLSPIQNTALHQLQNKQNRYKTQVKGKAERAIKAVKPAATEEEMTAVFAQEDGVTRVLEAAVMQQSGDPVEVANGK